MENKDLADYLSIVRMIEWTGDLTRVPLDVRTSFAQYVLRQMDMAAPHILKMKQAIKNGNIIEAIRIHRQATNSGLKEAKEFAERMRFEMGLSPEQIRQLQK